MRIAVRLPNWLGDLVMSLPALNSIYRSCTLCGAWVRPELGRLIPVFFPDINIHDLTDPPERSDYDTLVLFTDSFRTAFEGFRTGIRKRVGRSGEMRRMLLSRPLRSSGKRSQHHSRDYMELALAAGAKSEELPLSLISSKGNSHLAFFAGATYGPAKIWPGDRYVSLCNRLCSLTGKPAVFYGGEKEKQYLESISGQIKDSTVISGIPLDRLSSLLLSSQLTIGNDSGGTHLSAALGIPTVSIFGSTDPEWTKPLGEKVTVLYSDRSCSPCFKRSCRFSDSIPPCLDDISVDVVLEKSIELVNDVELTRTFHQNFYCDEE